MIFGPAQDALIVHPRRAYGGSMVWLALIALIVLAAAVLLLGGVRKRHEPAQRLRHH